MFLFVYLFQLFFCSFLGGNDRQYQISLDDVNFPLYARVRLFLTIFSFSLIQSYFNIHIIDGARPPHEIACVCY